MAKIKKVIENGGIQYPATITDAVKNPNNGKTVTEELSELGSEVNYYIYFNNYHIPSFSESINGYEGNQSITVTLPTDFRIQSLRGVVAIGHKMESQTFVVNSLQHLILNYKTFAFRIESYTAKLSDNELVLLAVGATDVRGLLAPHYYRWKNCQLNEKGNKLEKEKVDGLLSRDCVNIQTIDNTTTPYHINNYIDSDGRGRVAIVFKIDGGLSKAVVSMVGLTGFLWSFGADDIPFIGDNFTYVVDKYDSGWLESSKTEIVAVFPKAEYVILLFRKPNQSAISEEEFEQLKNLKFSIKTALTDTYRSLSEMEDMVKDNSRNIGKESVSFDMKAGSGHSSLNNKIFINEEKGATVILSVISDKGLNNDVQYFAYNDDGTSYSLGSSKVGNEYSVVLSDKCKEIGVFVAAPNEDTTMTFTAKFSLTGKSEAALENTLKNQERIKYVEEHSNYYIYFNNYHMPSFSENKDTYEGTKSITVTLPVDFRIQSLRGVVAIGHKMESQTFVVNSLQHLILNYKTFEFRVDGYSSKLSEDEIVLLAIGATDIHGLLAPHYYRWKYIQLNEKSNGLSKDTNEGLESVFVSGEDITKMSDYSGFENIGYAIDGNGRGRMWMYKATSSKKGITKITSIPSGYKVIASFGSRVYYNADTLVLDAIGGPKKWRVSPFSYYQESEDIKLVGVWIAKSNDGVLTEDEFESLKTSVTFEIIEVAPPSKDNFNITERYNDTEKVNIKSNLLKNCDFVSMFLSDLHSSKAHWERVVELANSWEANINCIIDGGDDTNSYTNNDDYAWFDSVSETSKLPILRAVGNHDAWTSDYWVWDTKENIYQIITSKVVSQVNKLGETIYQPNNAEQLGLNYYYYDSGNIRVIVLCGLGMDGEKYYDDTQNNWLKSVLADAVLNNKAVICVNHAPIKQDNSEPLDSSWYSKYIGWSNGEMADHQHILNSALDCVDEFIDNGGTFICWLAGHTHVDYLMTTKNQKHKQMCFATTCAMSRVGDGVKGSEPTFESYDSFNVIGIDTSKGLVKVWRIGYNLNATMQLHNAFVWDYRNKELVSEF